MHFLTFRAFLIATSLFAQNFASITLNANERISTTAVSTRNELKTHIGGLGPRAYGSGKEWQNSPLRNSIERQIRQFWDLAFQALLVPRHTTLRTALSETLGLSGLVLLRTLCFDRNITEHLECFKRFEEELVYDKNLNLKPAHEINLAYNKLKKIEAAFLASRTFTLDELGLMSSVSSDDFARELSNTDPSESVKERKIVDVLVKTGTPVLDRVLWHIYLSRLHRSVSSFNLPKVAEVPEWPLYRKGTYPVRFTFEDENDSYAKLRMGEFSIENMQTILDYAAYADFDPFLYHKNPTELGSFLTESFFVIDSNGKYCNETQVIIDHLAELFRSFLDNDNYIQLAPFRNSVIHHFNHRSTKKLQFDDLNPDYSDSKKLVWKFKSFVYGSPARNGKNEFIRGDLEPAVFVYRFIDSLTEQILPFLEHLIAAEKFRRKNYDSVNFKPTNPVLPEEILYYFIEDSFDLAFKKEYSRELERYKQQLGVLKRKFQSAKYQLYALGLVELQAPYSSRRPMVGRRGVIPVINRFIHGARPALSQIGESLRCWASFTTGSNQ